MKKRLLVLVTALVLMTSLCSCGKNTEDETYAGYTSEMLQASCEKTASSLISLESDEIMQCLAYYQSQGQNASEDEELQIEYTMLTQWAEIQPEVGDFVGFKDFEVTKAGKTISAVETMEFEERDVTLTYVISSVSQEVTAINVQMVYSKGEIMAKAGMNTIMGLGIVFFVLVLIAIVIYAFNIIPYITNKLNSKKNDSQDEVVADSVPKNVASVDSEDMSDDLELVAVITAAIAASTGASTDDFVVRSIKRRY